MVFCVILSAQNYNLNGKIGDKKASFILNKVNASVKGKVFPCPDCLPIEVEGTWNDNNISLAGSSEAGSYLSYTLTVDDNIVKGTEYLCDEGEEEISIIDMTFSTQAYAQNVIGEETYEDYRLERYSDGTSKIFDKNNNWIHFYTEYRENEYTGERTIPYELQTYLPKTNGFSDYGAIFEARIHDQFGYSLELNSNSVLIKTPSDLSYYISHFRIQKLNLRGVKESQQKLGIIDSGNEQSCLARYGVSRNKYIPSLVTQCFITDIKTHISDFLGTVRIIDTKIGIKGVNGNNLSLKNVHLKGVRSPFPIPGYYDPLTQRIYYFVHIEPGSPYPFDFSAFVDTSNKEESAYYCLPTDTIVGLKSNDNVEEVYFKNGDYIKYSKLKYGAVYDCLIHRPNGIWTVKLDNGVPKSKFEFTTKEWQGLVYTDEIQDSDYGLCLVKENIVADLCEGDSLYNPKTNKYQVLLNDGTFFYGSYREYKDQLHAKRKAKENAEIQARKAEKQKQLRPLYQKYGKRYVDALFKQGTILVGTPEGLVRNHTKSELISETQTTRKYKVSGTFRDWASTVVVSKKTKKVISVKNWTY